VATAASTLRALRSVSCVLAWRRRVGRRLGSRLGHFLALRFEELLKPFHAVDERQLHTSINIARQVAHPANQPPEGRPCLLALASFEATLDRVEVATYSTRTLWRDLLAATAGRDADRHAEEKRE
jgi:hypothetical protein